MADYQDYGFENDHPSHAFHYLQKPLLNLLNADKTQYILDIGCGNGYLANYLVSKGYNAYGTDASVKGIEIAKKANPDRFFIQDIASGNIPVQLQNIQFSTIISTEVIEHLYNPAAFIALCKKSLAPGGELIISTPYHGYLKNLMLALLNRWDTHVDPNWLGGHIKFWSAGTLGLLLKQHEFEVISFKGCGRIPYLWKSMIIKARLL